MTTTPRLDRPGPSDTPTTRPADTARLRGLAVGAGLIGTLLLAACGGSANAGPDAAPSGGAAASTAAPAVGAGSGAAPASTAAAGSGSAATGSAAVAGSAVKVSANKATRAQLQQTFEAAGIPNAARMAIEVEEYRPYPTNDPSFAKLRQELAKYNIPTNVVDQIIATLTLD
jgi:hypothetical protein